MPSPFPGMDPYLEDPARWPGVHQRLITYVADALQPHIRPRYVATIGERVYVVSHWRSIYPDVVLVRRPVREAAAAYEATKQPAPVEVATPWIVSIPSEPRRVPYIEILQTDTGELVTVIEILSPVNKTEGEGREQFAKKQIEVLNSQANLVEIDLLGMGLRVTPQPLDELGRVPFHRYIIGVYRAADREHIELYPIQISERLPRFRVPLRHPDPDVILDLQAALDRCYDNGGFADLIDYSKPPPTLLSSKEMSWLNERLRAR